MAQRPLDRTRLHAILDLFEPGVTMALATDGDMGVTSWYEFTGRTRTRMDPSNAVVGGRIVRNWGFASESIVASRNETTARDGPAAYWRRVERRGETLARWLAEHPSGRTTEEDACTSS